MMSFLRTEKETLRRCRFSVLIVRRLQELHYFFAVVCPELEVLRVFQIDKGLVW